MNIFLPHLCLLILAMLFMAGLWLWQCRSGNAGVADAGWALCMVMMGLGFAGLTEASPAWRGWVIGAMAAFWAGRLGLFILLNRVVGRPEDRRYAALRARYGSKANRFFLVWFMAQAPFSLLFGLCFWVAMLGQTSVFLALPVYLVAVGGELLSDWQLARFRARPESRGTTCKEGLWRFSRHPNYFFEWLHWWTYVILAFGSPWFLLSLLGPALMLLMLFKVSGIPLTEARALESRADYKEYQETTSVFIPWFPRRKAG